MINPEEETKEGPSSRIDIISSEQQDFITDPKIPRVNRNPHTGWPLLQVSLFTVAEGKSTEGQTLYTQVLGGGKCHYLNVGAFLFAKLLLQVPPLDKVKVEIANQLSTPHAFSIENLRAILSGYSVSHNQFKITIKESLKSNGKLLKASTPVGKKGSLEKTLRNSFSFAMLDTTISSIGDWDSTNTSSKCFTEKEIKEAYDPKRAIFLNGQIFIDLGFLLKSGVEESDSESSFGSDAEDTDNELIDYLAGMFQVRTFLSLSKQKLDLKLPSITETKRPDFALETIPQVTPILEKTTWETEPTNLRKRKRSEAHDNTPGVFPITRGIEQFGVINNGTDIPQINETEVHKVKETIVTIPKK